MSRLKSTKKIEPTDVEEESGPDSPVKENEFIVEKILEKK